MSLEVIVVRAIYLLVLLLAAPVAAQQEEPEEPAAPMSASAVSERSEKEEEGVGFRPAGGFFGDGVLALGLGVSPRVDMALTHGRALGVEAAAGQGEGLKGVAGGFRLQLAYQIPVPSGMLQETPALRWLDRLVGVELEAGYALSGTSGTVSFEQYEATADGVQRVTTSYEYGGLLHQVPLSAGLRARVPVLLGLPGLYLDGSGGFEGVLGVSTSTGTVSGADAPFTRDNTATDFAWGFYLEGGVAFGLGPGEVTGAYRYSSAYLNFGHERFNPTPGDLGGHHLLVGYRVVL